MVLDLPGGLFGQDDVRETILERTETKFWSCTGGSMVGMRPDIDDCTRDNNDGDWSSQADNHFPQIGVNLPHGAIVTACIVTGSNGAKSWVFRRVVIGSKTASTLAAANLNTEDTSITNATIDNSTYGYWLIAQNIDTGEEIYGARIIYTIVN